MDPLSCGWDTARYFIFSENVFAPLIYYSHLAPLIFSVLLGVTVLFNEPRALINRIFFATMAFFSIWILFDLILWASEKPDYIMFFWSAIVPIELLIYAAAWYFVAVYVNHGRDIAVWRKIVMFVAFVPMILFTHTAHNLLGFDLTNCDREAIEGPLVQYLYILELLIVGWIAGMVIRAYRKLGNRDDKRQLLLVSTGVLCFLVFFSVGNILVSYFLEVDWSYEQYKLFGMPIFAALITYSAIRFKTFNLKIFLAQALVIALSILVFSLLFIRTIATVRFVTLFTFALVLVLGYILIRNVRREIEQRQLIEEQEHALEIANRQQQSLLHFISHEIKGYLTDGQNAFAAIIEGDVGSPSPQMLSLSQTALGKMRQGVRTVMDILDASNLKQGTVGYKKQPFDFKTMVQDVVEHMRVKAAERGLTLDLTIGEAQSYTMNGDKEKIAQHVIRNLIDNAIRYTPKGSIHVAFIQRGSRIHFSVKDTGVGITAEDMKRLFTEGGHGKDSIRVNVDSTGYGLFVAKQVVEAHGGKIWAESAGAGKGSEFIVELPVT